MPVNQLEFSWADNAKPLTGTLSENFIKLLQTSCLTLWLSETISNVKLSQPFMVFFLYIFQFYTRIWVIPDKFTAIVTGMSSPKALIIKAFMSSPPVFTHSHRLFSSISTCRTQAYIVRVDNPSTDSPPKALSDIYCFLKVTLTPSERQAPATFSVLLCLFIFWLPSSFSSVTHCAQRKWRQIKMQWHICIFIDAKMS